VASANACERRKRMEKGDRNADFKPRFHAVAFFFEPKLFLSLERFVLLFFLIEDKNRLQDLFA
jgi:hypothetical protein